MIKIKFRTNPFESFEIGIWVLFGIWCLEIGASACIRNILAPFITQVNLETAHGCHGSAGAHIKPYIQLPFDSLLNFRSTILTFMPSLTCSGRQSTISVGPI